MLSNAVMAAAVIKVIPSPHLLSVREGLNKGLTSERHGDVVIGLWYGGLGDFDGALGCLHGLPAGLRTHYAVAPRIRWRRAINKLAKAQVTSRRWVFLLSPR